MNQEQKDYLQSMKTVFKESKEYVKNYQINDIVFKSLGFEDSSWGNDLCPSYSKISKDEKNHITIWFPNSDYEDLDEERFNTFSVGFHYGDFELFLNNIDEVFSLLLSNKLEKIFFNEGGK